MLPYIDVAYNHGLCLSELRRPEEAVAAVLMRGDKAQEALPYFRQAASLAPADPGAQLGLAQCLEALGSAYLDEATNAYLAIVKRFSDPLWARWPKSSAQPADHARPRRWRTPPPTGGWTW